MMSQLLSKNKIKTGLQLGFIVAAVFSLIYGLWRGEASIVLQKAIRVCLECIGIG